MTRPSLLPETYEEISKAQESTNLTPEQQDAVDLKAAVTVIKSGCHEAGWRLIVKVLNRKFGTPLTIQDAILLAAARARFEKQIEEVNNESV